jgi:hypothetical protein
MRKFIIKTLIFVFSAIILFPLIPFLFSPTPRAKTSLLFAEIKKDSLLLHVASPRIIFVGGSNLSFGLNSQMIKDSLGLNPINTAIHAGVGIKYMLENTLQYIEEGDIIVFMPEYSLFNRKWDCGSEVLLRMVLDVDKSKIKQLSIGQMISCIPYIGNVVFSKLNRSEYIKFVVDVVYSVNSFNQYGDAVAHWNKGSLEISPDTLIEEAYNPEAMVKIKEISRQIQKKKASFYISFPVYQEESFFNSAKFIKKVEEEYKANGFIVLGAPERYKFPDSLLFNSTYHSNKKGADYRTMLLIEDIRKGINR